MSILGFAESAEAGLFNIGMVIARAGAVSRADGAARVTQEVSASLARRASAANADYDHVVGLLAASRQENATLRAALDGAHRECLSLADEVQMMRAEVGAH